jgi:RNAse (barnase) inhibitor barstar
VSERDRRSWPAARDRLLQPARSGVYLAPVDAGPLREAAARANLVWFELDAADAPDKQAFLAACGRALEFPGWFGNNWDALADCLRDFSWRQAPGYIVLWRGGAVLARAARDEFATALEIFRDASSYWQEQGRVFIVLLDHEPAGVALPRLPAA